MDRTTYRWLLVVLGMALVAVIVLVIALDTDGDPADLPAPLQSVLPLPSDAVVRQAGIEVVLPVGYELAITVDGVRIPPDEITVLEGVGLHRWQPGPGRIVAQWGPGEHTVEISWDRIAGRPDPGEFRWTFRVT